MPFVACTQRVAARLLWPCLGRIALSISFLKFLIFAKSVVNLNPPVAWVHLIFTLFQILKLKNCQIQVQTSCLIWCVSQQVVAFLRSFPPLPVFLQTLGTPSSVKPRYFTKRKTGSWKIYNTLLVSERMYIPAFQLRSAFPAVPRQGVRAATKAAVPTLSPGLQPLQLVHFLSYTQVAVLINKVLESDGSIE